jgi:hypothetical protein
MRSLLSLSLTFFKEIQGSPLYKIMTNKIYTLTNNLQNVFRTTNVRGMELCIFLTTGQKRSLPSSEGDRVNRYDKN